MGFDSALSRDNELASTTTTSDRETDTRPVGKRTLTESLPAVRSQPSMFAQRPGGSLVTEPAADARVSFSVVLPENLREQIRSVYAQYIKTGVVIDISGIITQLHGLALGTAAPDLTEAQIDAEVAKKRELTVQGNDSSGHILAWLVGLPAALPPWRKGAKLPARAAMSSVDISFSSKEVERLRGPAQQPVPVEQVSTVGALLDWGWGVIMGDFNEEATIGQTAVNALIGMIPVVDQILDVRDIVANLYFLIGQQRYDEFGPWFGLVITVIGCVPEVGSPVKGIVNIARKVARRIPIGEAVSAAKIGVKLLRPAIEKMLGSIVTVGIKVAAKARSLVNSALGLFARLRDTLGLASEKVAKYFGELVNRAREVLARLETKVREAMKEVQTRLKQLYDDLVGASDDVPVKQGDQTLPLPKNETTLPISKKPTEQTTVPKKPTEQTTLPTQKKKPVNPSDQRGDWWQRKPMELELDPANFRIEPKRLGYGSMSDVFEHKKNWVMKTLNDEVGFDMLSDVLASKLFSKIVDLNDRAAQILGKDVVPKSHALSPIKQGGDIKYRPVLVQQRVVGDAKKGTSVATLESFRAQPFYKDLISQASGMAQKLSDQLGLPSIEKEAKKGWDKMTEWSIDSGTHNFLVVETKDATGKVVDRALRWFDPFFPPSAAQIIANPKLVD